MGADFYFDPPPPTVPTVSVDRDLADRMIEKARQAIGHLRSEAHGRATVDAAADQLCGVVDEFVEARNSALPMVFVCAGACVTGTCDCRQLHGKRFPAGSGMHARHEGCHCYLEGAQ